MTPNKATELVRRLLLTVTSVSRDTGTRKRLKSLGVTGQVLRAFKIILAEALNSSNISLSARQLRFSENSTIGQVAALIVAKSSAKTSAATSQPAPPLKPLRDAQRRSGIASKTHEKKAIPTGVGAKKQAARKAIVSRFSANNSRPESLQKPLTGLSPSVASAEVAADEWFKKGSDRISQIAASSSTPAEKKDTQVLTGLQQGRVRWFNEAKGFGFISYENDDQIFVHHSAVTSSGFRSLQEGQQVHFEVVEGLGGERRAANVQVTQFVSGMSGIRFHPSEVYEKTDRLPESVVMPEVVDGGPNLPEPISDAVEPVPEAGKETDSSTDPVTGGNSLLLECIPLLEMAKRMPSQRLYQLEVSLGQQVAPAGAQVQNIQLKYPQGTSEIPVEVWFDSSSQLTLEDLPSDPNLIVDTATGTSSRVTFYVRDTEANPDGPMYLSAFFRYSGRPCGKITRFLKRTSKGLQWITATAPAREHGEVVLPNEATSAAVTVEMSGQPADIRVEVLKTDANDGQHFTLRCSTDEKSWHGPWNLPQVTKDLVNSYMKTFMKAKGNARIASLRAAGIAFWEALPQKARLFLLDAIEKQAQSISILSEEPYIPWELMIPYRKLNARRKPLGVELNVGRWVTGDYTSPPQSIPMRSIYVVCPKSSGLESSQNELKYLAGLGLSPSSAIEPADFNGVDAALRGPVRDVVHFICHGKSDASIQTLQLEKPDTIDCSQVRVMDGFLKAFANGGFAFLNACEVGGATLALDGVGGFANSFIELGASSVVAPLWAVQDTIALAVSQMFYGEALKGKAFSEIMKMIRAKAYDDAVDSYAAYCFYGDPHAHIALTATTP